MLTSRIGLAALSLLATLPYLVPVHTSPIPSFHSEWVAGCLGLAAGVALLGARRLPLPGAALLAVALAGIAWLQMFVGRAPVPQLTTLFALYLLWAALLAATGAHLADAVGKEKLVRTVAAALLLGALLSALASLLQPWLTAPNRYYWLPPRYGGPIAQTNHLSSYLWLGLASAVYLRTTKAVSGSMFWLAAFVLTLAAVVVGQRSSFIYALTLIGIAAWQARGMEKAAKRGTLRPALGIGLLFLLLQPVTLVMPEIYAGGASPPPALRAVQQLSGPSVRLQLLRLGIAGIVAAPLTGNGVGSYPGLSAAHAYDIAPADNPGPSEHAHNFFVHLGAELGVFAVLLALAACVIWLRRLPQRAAPAEAAWGVAVLGIVGLHAMIEYPLWYAYFLGLFAVVAGIFGSQRGTGSRLTPVAATLGALVFGGLLLASLMRDYRRIELALAVGKHADYVPAATAALLKVPQASLLTPWIDTTACISLDPLRVAVADGLAVCRVAVAFAPTPQTETHWAAVLWRAGRVEEAQALLHRTRRASPLHAKDIDELLAPLVKREPGLAALREP